MEDDTNARHSNTSPTEVNYMEQSVYRELFLATYSTLLNTGMTPTDAAAHALAKLQQSISNTNHDSLQTIDIVMEKSIGMKLKEALEDVMNNSTNEKLSQVKALTYEIFSNINILNKAFLSSQEEYYWGINRELVENIFHLLSQVSMEHTPLNNTLRNALEALVNQPWNICSTWIESSQLRFFLVLWDAPILYDPEYLNVTGGLCKLFFHLPLQGKLQIQTQWAEYYTKDELLRLLEMCQQMITVCLYGVRKFDLVYAACSVLKELHALNYDEKNLKFTRVIGFATVEDFYNDAINSEVDIIHDYTQSLLFAKRRHRALARAERERNERRRNMALSQTENNNEEKTNDSETNNTNEHTNTDGNIDMEENIDEEFVHSSRMLSELSFCDFPFVLDAGSKSRVLKIDSDLEQREYQNQIQTQTFASPLRALLHSPYLILKVHRDNIIYDSLQQLNRMDRLDMKKPLKVKFIGEEGIDEGGVTKEFFQILIRELMDPNFGMFTPLDNSSMSETYTVYFNGDSLEAHMEFELIGILIGLAIYNSVILNVNFPHIVYKKLLNVPLTFQDLKIALPDLAHGLEQLLNYEESESNGTVEDVFQRNFEYSYEVFGSIKTVELIENGENVPVTAANRQEYVDLYVDYLFNKSVKKQYDAFHRGFHLVVNPEVMEMFRWEELLLLVCGSEELDFEALESVTHYDDGFTEDSLTIKYFWEIVHKFSLDQKKMLLKFVTGSDRVPIRGLSSMVFVISRNGSDSDRLPTAHTCFNHLLLPEYTTKEKMEERILLAISQSEGFGLR